MKINTREAVWDSIVGVLTEILAERGEEPAGIEPKTMLNAELGITSMDAIHMMVMLEERLNALFNFQELAISGGEYVEDLAVGEVHNFISDRLGLSQP